MPQLDPTWYVAQLFWLAIIVVFMHLVLKHFLLPRLMRVTIARDDVKVNSVHDAEQFKREAETARLQYEQALADARARAQAAFTEAETRIKESEARSQAALDKDIASRVADASGKLKAQVDDLKKHLQTVSSELVADMAAKITGTPVKG